MPLQQRDKVLRGLQANCGLAGNGSQCGGAPPETADQPPLMAVPGVSRYSFAIDTLHVMELGITSHALGNCLFLLRQEYPGTRAQSVDALRARIQELYDELGSPSRFSRFDFGTFATPAAPHQNYPQLGGGIKARETRSLVPVVLRLCEERNDGSPKHLHRVLMLRALNRAYELIDASRTFLSEAARAEFREFLDWFLLHYSWLAKAAHQERRKLWSLVPKFHYAAHLPDQADFLSPRACWTYPGETMVGKISNLGHSCLAGTPSRKVSQSLMAKYRVAMHLSFTLRAA